MRRKAQAEVITTVLLILIAIVAVAIVSVFVINLVRSNLGNTDCFKTIGQIKIVSGDYTFSSSNNVSLSVERGQADFNLTGIGVVLGTASASKTFELYSGAVDKVIMFDGSSDIKLPNPGEKLTYIFNVAGTSYSNSSQVNVFAIIGANKKKCDSSDEKELLIR